MARESTTKPKGRPGSKWGGSKYVARRRVCTFCANKSTRIDYKDVGLLGRYLTDRAKILPRRRTGNCARHQRALATAIKRARYLALLPYSAEHIYEMGANYDTGRSYYRKEPVKTVAPVAEATQEQAPAELSVTQEHPVATEEVAVTDVPVDTSSEKEDNKENPQD